MIYLDCPLNELCPLDGEDCFEFDVLQDSDGDEIYTRTFYIAELAKQHCPCELTDAEVAALDEVVSKRLDDWEPNDEPFMQY